jgi:hypothetical protein
MTIVMIREERNHDLQHDLGYMEYRRVSVTLKSVVLHVIDMRRLSGSFLAFAGSRIVSDNGWCKRSNSVRRASRKLDKLSSHDGGISSLSNQVVAYYQWRSIPMSFTTEHRSFAIGQEVGGCGRCTRFVLGLLLLVSIGTSVAQNGPSAALIGQLAGGLLLTAVLYIVLFWVLGASVLSHLQPWIRTGIFWAPMMFIPLLLLISWRWGFGVLLYLSVSLLVAALLSYGGCEMVAFPSLLFQRYYTVYCPLNAIDLVERRYTQR